MTSEIVYQNSAHRDYDHSVDDNYYVRIPGDWPGAEWYVISPSYSRDEFEYTPYTFGKNPTREQAEFFLREYSVNHPDTPVRVERQTLTPSVPRPIWTFDPETGEHSTVLRRKA